MSQGIKPITNEELAVLKNPGRKRWQFWKPRFKTVGSFFKEKK